MSSTTSKAIPKLRLTWTRITPAADPSHSPGAPIARSSHGISLLHNPRRIFVYGGEHEARTPIAPDQAAWQVNLDEPQPQWRKVDCRHGPSPRIAHAQAVDPATNTVYVFGGRAGILMKEQAMNDLWSFKDGVWTEIIPSSTSSSSNDSAPPADVPCPRSFHRMICLDNQLYVFGGCGAAGRLADLHKFDLATYTWEALPVSSLRGRGGPNLMALRDGQALAVIAGFAGEETKDGQVYEIKNKTWSEGLMETELQDMRPRSVCVSGSLPSARVSIIFGGEVNPSDRGHEGAGGFANDVCLLDETTGAFLESVRNDAVDWPQERGWAAGAVSDNGNGTGELHLFGGLSGDDTSPLRLDDFWRLDIVKCD